jgi:hypothetical protein
LKTLSLALVMLLALCAGCAATLHKPTTTGNAGTSALVAYASAGFVVSKYLALPLCEKPPQYPCKTQATNDRLLAADTAAHDAAVAADKAGNDNNKQVTATAALANLGSALNDPYVKSQIAIVNSNTAKGGAQP